MELAPDLLSPGFAEVSPEEAVAQSMRLLAEQQIGLGEETIFAQARAAVRRALPDAEPETVDRRAAALVAAARRQVDERGIMQAKLKGIDRDCGTCRWSSYSSCKHPLSVKRSLHKTATQKSYASQQTARGYDGHCGPEGILWAHRTLWQRWWDLDNTTGLIFFFTMIIITAIALAIGAVIDALN